MDNENLRVLYVGHILQGDDSATGKTLHNIYSNCTNIEFKQYCLDYDPSYHSTTVSTLYISKLKSALFYIFKNLYRKIFDSKHDNISPNSSVASSITHKSNGVVAFFKALLDVLPKKMSVHSIKEIDAFNPNVVLTMGENISCLKTAHTLSERYNIPIVLHIMDDIENSIYGDSVIVRYFRKKYLSLLKEVYARTKYNLAISEKMANEYQQRHNVHFSNAMNCIYSLHRYPHPNNKKLRFVFSGGLHGGRGETLYEMGKIIKNNENLKNKITLSVYTSKKYIDSYSKKFEDLIELNNYVPEKELFENLGKADILVHVESFEQSEIDYFRYSMSTKIPECLSVGRPILCYGSTEICTVSYIEEKKVGIVADTPEKLIEAIKLLVSDEKLRGEISKNALKVAENEHLASSVATRVEKVFEKSIKMWRENNVEY